MFDWVVRQLIAPRALLAAAIVSATITSALACPNMATASATCVPDRSVRIVEHAIPPGSWNRPQLGLKPVYVRLDVEVDADGRFVAARVLESSGWKSIDAATVNAARDSKYQAAAKHCKTYAAHVVFTQRYPVTP